MKRWGIITGVLLLCLVLAGSVACQPGGGQGTTSREVEVVRGDLAVSVSGSGTFELVDEAELFFGVGGRIDEINVEEGDIVGKGDVIARLETDDLELALAQAQVAQAQTQVAQAQAEVALELARFNLDRMEDVQEIKDDIEEAEWELKYGELRLEEANRGDDAGEIRYWHEWLAGALLKLASLQTDLADLLSKDGYASLTVTEVQIKALQVKAAEQSVAQAEQAVAQAEKAVAHARKQLDDAVITAPFSGKVARVYAEDGDIIPSPTMSPRPVIHLIDPEVMELEVELDELDIPRVQPGQKAIITVDALPDAEFEGLVASIDALPSPQAGVVLYDVTLSLVVPGGSGLRIGMSAEADIIIEERLGVLLVPERAVTWDDAGNPIVKVSVEGGVEQRPVVVGISDGLQTEIVSGVTEGETVVVEIKAKSAESTSMFGF